MEYAHRDAILQAGRRPLTFGGLGEDVRRIGARLREAGIRDQGRVGIVMPGGAPTAVATLGVASTATAVPFNPDYTRHELARLFRRMRIDALALGSAASEARIAGSGLQLPIIDVEVGDDVAGRVELRPKAPVAGDPSCGPDAHGHSPHGRAPGDRIALLLHTSGSTAEPKIVPLSDANLLTSATNVARSLALTERDLCLSTMPLFHIGALVDLLLAPLSVGGRVVVADGMTTSEFFEHVDHFAPTWFQGVPTMLSALLRAARQRGDAAPAAGLRLVRSVSAPLSPDMMTEFERVFDVPVIEIYGMTETAGLITSNPLPPGVRRPGSVGLPAGPEVAIVDGAGNVVPHGQPGEVVVRGPNVTAGYEGQPRVEAFLGEWLRTGDAGTFDSEGYLHLTGRLKELINRGGEKLAPREIDEVVSSHPEVQEAAAYPVPHETLGEDVAVAVVSSVAEAEQARLREEILGLCRTRLAEFKVPRSIAFLPELPRAPGGKLQRHRLAERARSDPGQPTRNPDGDGWDETRRLIAELWRDLLDVDDVGLHDDFFDLGGDSLSAAEFVEALAARTDVSVPPAALFDHPTVSDLSEALGPVRAPDEHADPEPDETRVVVDEVRAFLTAWMGRRPRTDSLLVGWNTLGGRPPLFFGVQSYGELASFAGALGADQPVYGMRSLHGARTKSPENLVRLAEHYATEIVALRPDHPIDLGGYCAGGRLAHLVACELRARGHPVRSLSLIEHAPERDWDGPLDCFFHVDSGFHDFSAADRSWLRGLSGPVRLHPTHADHHAIVSDPRTMTALRRTLDPSTLRGEDRAHEPAFSNLEDRAHESAFPTLEVRLDVRRVMVSRVGTRARIGIFNGADDPLPEASGVFLRWSRPGSERLTFDADILLEDALQPGQRRDLDAEIVAPLAPGPWHLHVEIVVAGDWALPAMTRARPRTLFVLPGPAVFGYVARRMPGRSIWSSDTPPAQRP